VREAVERTVQATVGSAGRTRNRAQGAVDDLAETVDELVRGAESGLARSGRAVRGAIPATQDDLRAIRAELRAIGRRLESIEERLPARRKRSSSGKTRSGGRGRSS
jgi:hypothetical protein